VKATLLSFRAPVQQFISVYATPCPVLTWSNRVVGATALWLGRAVALGHWIADGDGVT
jgi:hypothetical protein